jgi:hypothetical protein
MRITASVRMECVKKHVRGDYAAKPWPRCRLHGARVNSRRSAHRPLTRPALAR